MNSERENYPMKEFRAIFPISSILVKMYAKKGQFLILAVFQNVWDLHKFGLQIWIHNAKNYPMKEFRAIFASSSILVIRSGYAKKGRFPVLAVFQIIWDLHKFRLQIWIHNTKITLRKNFGQFFRFHEFWSSCKKKKTFLNISCISKCMGFT